MARSYGYYMMEMTQKRWKNKLSHSNALRGSPVDSALHKVFCRYFSKDPEKFNETWLEYLQQIAFLYVVKKKLS